MNKRVILSAYEIENCSLGDSIKKRASLYEERKMKRVLYTWHYCSGINKFVSMSSSFIWCGYRDVYSN